MENNCCPRCKEALDTALSSHFHERAWMRLDLPYFLCHRCRRGYYDSSHISSIVKEWRKNNPSLKNIWPSALVGHYRKALQEIIRERGYAYHPLR